MADTYSSYMNLLIPETRKVGWGDDMANDFALLDYGGRGNYFLATFGEDVTANQAVAWDTTANKVVKAQISGSAPKPAIGVAISTTSNGSTGGVLTRGWLETGSWTIGDAVYLGTTAGALVASTTVTDYLANSDNDEELIFQQIGRATSTTRIFIDCSRWRRAQHYTINSGRGFLSSGTAPEGFITVGSGKAITYRLSGAGSAVVIYPFYLPPYFRALPSFAAWGFKVRYVASNATPTAQVTNLASKDANGAPSPADSATNTTSWDHKHLNMTNIAGASLSLARGEMLYVSVTLTGASAQTIDIETTAQLRFLPQHHEF